MTRSIPKPLCKQNAPRAKMLPCIRFLANKFSRCGWVRVRSVMNVAGVAENVARQGVVIAGVSGKLQRATAATPGFRVCVGACEGGRAGGRMAVRGYARVALRVLQRCRNEINIYISKSYTCNTCATAATFCAMALACHGCPAGAGAALAIKNARKFSGLGFGGAHGH